MKMTITTEDVNDLNGKFIIQLDTPSEDRDYHTTINDKNWEFLKEKRISFVCGLTLNGFYYKHNVFENIESFVKYFNDVNDYKRYHRLLTSKELDFVLEKMKKDNY